MQFKRLFTFGCSFTQYWRWPTWADALGQQAEYFENWGLCGSGNSYSLYSLMECHQRHNIGPDDTVMVMWTNTSREDRYLNNRWQEGGNVYWSAGSKLPHDYVKNFTCERGFLIRDLAVISATRHFLNSTGCHWKFTSMVPLRQTNEYSGMGNNPDDTITQDNDVRDLYSDVLDCILPSVYETVFNGDWKSRPGIPNTFDGRTRDFHSTPIEHVEYLDAVFPNWIDSSSREWMKECDAQAKNNTLNWRMPNLPKQRL